MERTGIPASIKMAQAILESGGGTSTLSHKAKNHFGIKCSNNWQGDTYYHEDDDYKNGKLIKSCFRKYKSPSESFIAHSEFLQVNRRYASLFELDPTDYHGWAKGLKKAGYATAKTYDKRLISLIEEYELYNLDLGIDPDSDMIASTEPVFTPPTTVITKPSPKPQTSYPTTVETPASTADYTAGLNVSLLNEVKYVVARPGDTPRSIADETAVASSRLVRYNEGLTKGSQVLKGGELVYLQPKRSSFRGKKKYHYIKAGETMFDISQIYGIRLAKLYTRNRLNPGYEPSTGSKIKIKGGKIKVGERPRNSFPGNRTPIKVDDFQWENEKELDADLSASTITEVYKAPAKKPVVKSTAKPKPQPTSTVTNNSRNSKSINSSSQDTRTTTTTVVHEPMPAPKSTTTASTKPTTRPVVTKPSLQPVITRPQPATSTAPIRLPVKYHVVKKGETLYRLSKTYRIGVEDLKTLNDLSDNTIHVGQKVRVQ